MSSGDGNTPVRGREDMREGGREGRGGREGGREGGPHPCVHIPIFLMEREIVACNFVSSLPLSLDSRTVFCKGEVGQMILQE